MSANPRAFPVTVLDFESTGAVSGYPDEPWQLGLVRLAAGRVEPDSAYESLLRVGARPFNRHAPGRHAELRDRMREAPALPALWPRLAPLLGGGTVLAAHNAATEKKFLRAAFPLQAFGPWLDTLKLARIAWPGLPSYTLEALLDRLGLTARTAALAPGRGPHDALYDTVGSALLLETILHLPGWEQAGLRHLITAQAPR